MRKTEPILDNNYASILKYRKIQRELEEVLDRYYAERQDAGIIQLIEDSANRRANGMKNRVKEVPQTKNLLRYIKEQYLGLGDKEEYSAEIGTIPTWNQVDWIEKISMLILVSNRLAHYRGEQANLAKDEKIKEELRQKSAEAYNIKHKNLERLMACLYIYEQMEKDEEDIRFLYGYLKDKKADRTKNESEDAFAIDIPGVGQMAVHFGSQMKTRINKAIEQCTTIINRNYELGLISKEKEQKMLENLNEKTILPKYKGRHYELNAGIPTRYKGRNYKEVINALGLNKKFKEEITKEDLELLYNTELTNREIWFVAVKFGFLPKDLITLSEMFAKRKSPSGIARIDFTKIGEKARQKAINDKNIKENKLSIEQIQNIDKTVTPIQRQNAAHGIKDIKDKKLKPKTNTLGDIKK